MSTPNPMKHNPSQQGRTPSSSANGPTTATPPPGSTPFSTAGTAPYHAFSPRGGPGSVGPRSSPQQVKKSPANSMTLRGDSSHTMSTLPVNFDSPLAAAAMGVLGLDIGALEGTGVGSLTASLGSEDEKLKRLHSVIAILSKRKGVVSEEGLEKLARRLRLECLWEDTTLNGRKTKTLVIAGAALQIDIVLDTHVVVSATMSFPLSAPSVSRHSEEAGRVLFNDLKLRPDQSPLTKSLEKFAANLERLAELDKLSVMPGLDCHEALAGLYASLERLYEWDVAKTRHDPFLAGKSDVYMRSVVTCEKHGRPVMNARERVGLGLQYWMQRRHTPPRTADSQGYAENKEKLWTLILGCGRIESENPYTPIRISQDWISPGVEKVAVLDVGGMAITQLDWQEPPPTLLSGDAAKDTGLSMLQPDGTLSADKYPSVMFTATVEPPIVVPQTEALNLHACVHNQPSIYPWPTFDDLLFPHPSNANYIAGEPRKIVSVNTVTVCTPLPNMVTRRTTHHYNLMTYRGVYAQKFSQFPFSHPSQVIEMLPTLRQYAFVNTLLESSFGPEGVARATTANLHEDDRSGTETGTVASTVASTVKSDLADMVGKQAEMDGTRVQIDLRIDVNLSLHPVPRFQVMFPMTTAPGGEADITVEIYPGGVVQVVSQNVVPTGSSGSGSEGQRQQQEEEKEEEEVETAAAQGLTSVHADDGGDASVFLEGTVGTSGSTIATATEAARGKGKGDEKTRPQMIGGKEVKPHHLGYALETLEDLGKWCEWIRDRL